MRANLFGWLAVGAVAAASVVASSGAGAATEPLTVTTATGATPVQFTLEPGASSTSALTLTNRTAKQRLTVRLATTASVINVKAQPTVIEPGEHATMHFGVVVPVEAEPGEMQATIVARIDRAESLNGKELPTPSPVSVPISIMVTGTPVAATETASAAAYTDWVTPVAAGAVLLFVIFGLLLARRRTLRRRRAERWAVPVDAMVVDEPLPEPELDFDIALFDVEAVEAAEAQTEEDVVHEPVAEEPVAEERADEERVAEERVAEEPAADEPPEIIVELAANIANLTAAVDRLTSRLEQPLNVGIPVANEAPWRRALDQAFDWPSEEDLAAFLEGQAPRVDRTS